MQTIKDLINKILWDKNENKEDYSIFYLDRISKQFIELTFDDILRIEGNFLVLNREEETYIPLHRIRKVYKAGILFWQR